MDHAARVKLLLAMFELNLKRELTPEERRLLALSARFYTDEEPGSESDLAARGEAAS